MSHRTQQQIEAATRQVGIPAGRVMARGDGRNGWWFRLLRRFGLKRYTSGGFVGQLPIGSEHLTTTVGNIIWANPPIAHPHKGRLRWDAKAERWRWIDTGPKLSVVVLTSGLWQVNRVRI